MAIDHKYQALINADAEYSQYGAMTTAQSQADKAARDTAMRRSLEEFGQMPDFGASASSMGLSAADLASIYTPEAQGIANANTAGGTSTVARLKQAYADAQRNAINTLASRGMLRSGDTGYALNKASQTNTQSQLDARKTLLDYLAGAQSGYAEAEKTRQTGSYDALMAAYNRALTNWKDVAPAAGTATTPASAAATAPATAPATATGPLVKTLENPSSRVISDAYTGPTPNYGPAGPGFSGGYTSPQSVSPYAMLPSVPEPKPVAYNPYGVTPGANIYR